MSARDIADRDAIPACSTSDPELWFPTTGQPSHVAKRICAQCPLRLPCLQYALDHDIEDGIWGGTNGRQRRKLKKGAAA